MLLKKIDLINFRNHKKFVLDDFDCRNVLIIGLNGVGKTNIIESILYGSHLKTYRSSLEKDLVNLQSNFAKVTIYLSDGDFVEYILTRKAESNRITKSIRLNGVAKSSIRAIGHYKVVIFAPEDIKIVSGSPSRRRDFLDRIISQVSLDYRKNLYLYEKVLKSRNKLLETLSKASLYNPFTSDRTQFDFWNQKLLESGYQIQSEREKFFKFARENIKEISDKLFMNIDLKIIYQKSSLNELELKKSFDKDVFRKSTSIGPHRDDFLFLYNKDDALPLFNNQEAPDSNVESSMLYDLKSMGSRGQQRTAVLSLKLLELKYIELLTGQKPILLLDDIFSELDENYRSHVLNIIGIYQTFITTADINMVPDKIRNEFYNIVIR